jgi:DNA-binding cell septation regulator SpoVG
MNLSEIQITPIKPHNGLVAFASFVLGNELFCGSVGIVTRPSGGYRLVYPAKPVGNRQLNIFYPISSSFGKQLEEAVITRYEEVVNEDGRNRYSDLTT